MGHCCSQTPVLGGKEWKIETWSPRHVTKRWAGFSDSGVISKINNGPQFKIQAGWGSWNWNISPYRALLWGTLAPGWRHSSSSIHHWQDRQQLGQPPCRHLWSHISSQRPVIRCLDSNQHLKQPWGSFPTIRDQGSYCHKTFWTPTAQRKVCTQFCRYSGFDKKIWFAFFTPSSACIRILMIC
jgi:hypothetical protein